MLKEKTTYLENQSRRNNIRIDGITEEANENPEANPEEAASWWRTEGWKGLQNWSNKESRRITQRQTKNSGV